MRPSTAARARQRSATIDGLKASLGAAESEIFASREVNEAAFLKKKRRWDKRDGKAAGPTPEYFIGFFFLLS